MKYLYLRSLLMGDGKVVLQDLEPSEDNYYHLVRALKKRNDCPKMNRALLHKGSTGTSNGVRRRFGYAQHMVPSVRYSSFAETLRRSEQGPFHN
ncbi:hypothetical protein Y032_0081g1507 [Ancylostoma ceylanicum]|uniref:Uncharacterized protein n=1 Tax=Ancylostoma ceylanicum TaxID=53326 RepID=A0A016TRK0_9BILA|nr:hypothetical protein Y032_0081g1507 [Ancylostoma ceylanicum]